MKMTKTEYPGIGETLYIGELENGLQIRVVPKPGFSSFYAVYGTNYGGAMRRFDVDGVTTDTPAGVAHFLEHKMFDLPNGDNALTLLSASGADPNAFTSSGLTCYYFHCTENFEENLKLLLHFVSTPYFTPETVQKEQGIIGQEIQMGEDQPGSVLYYNLLGLLYAHHPIKDKIAGTIASIAEITDRTLYDCHKVFYAPSNMVLCVEGDVDPERIFAIAEEELPKERLPIPHADYGEAEGPLPVQGRKSVEMAVSSPLFYVGAKVNPDAAVREKLIGALSLRLLMGLSSPLYTRLYASGILRRDFDFEIDYSAGTGTVLIGGESPDPDRFLAELNAEIASLSIDSDYFDRTKRASIGSRLRSLEDFEDVCLSLLTGIFEGYCSFEVMDLLKSITKDECEAWIRDNLSPEKLAISIIVPGKV